MIAQADRSFRSFQNRETGRPRHAPTRTNRAQTHQSRSREHPSTHAKLVLRARCLLSIRRAHEPASSEAHTKQARRQHAKTSTASANADKPSTDPTGASPESMPQCKQTSPNLPDACKCKHSTCQDPACSGHAHESEPTQPRDGTSAPPTERKGGEPPAAPPRPLSNRDRGTTHRPGLFQQRTTVATSTAFSVQLNRWFLRATKQMHSCGKH
jgi:hypothetical protein